MSRSTPDDLQLDVRLIGRRGWITDKELEAKLSKLPDVSEKIASSTGPSSQSGAAPAPEAQPAGAETSGTEVSGADA